MRSPSLILGSIVLALSLQLLFAQTTEKQPNKLDLARASGFDFARVSDVARGEKAATVSSSNSDRAQALLALQAASLQNSLTEPNGGVCYNLRVYYFKRQGTEAPQMTGSTTCTPNRPVLKQADGASGPPPKARYVPQ